MSCFWQSSRPEGKFKLLKPYNGNRPPDKQTSSKPEPVNQQHLTQQTLRGDVWGRGIGAQLRCALAGSPGFSEP